EKITAGLAASAHHSHDTSICKLFRCGRPTRWTSGCGATTRIEPSRIGPAGLVVIRHAGFGETDHLIECAGAAGVPHCLDANVLVVAGVVHLVQLVASAEFRADRVPEQLHDLDAFAIAHAV